MCLYSISFSAQSWEWSSYKDRLKYRPLLCVWLCPKCLKFLWNPADSEKSDY